MGCPAPLGVKDSSIVQLLLLLGLVTLKIVQKFHKFILQINLQKISPKISQKSTLVPHENLHDTDDILLIFSANKTSSSQVQYQFTR